MSGGELAVVLASVAVVVAVAVLGAVGVSLSRSLKELRRLLGEIRRDLVPAVERIEEASGRVTGEVQRVGGLLDVAEAVSERAESLSRVTYRALVEPFAAVASLFRRGDPPEADTTAGSEPPVNGWAAAARRPSRRPSWTRRASVYLLRSGYQAASARIAARLAGVQAQRSAAPTTRAEATGSRGQSGDAGTASGKTSGGSPPGRSGATAAGSSWARQLTDAVREVTDEIFEAIEESRRTLRDDGREQERPE
ncbi:MAG: hypothetical protein F4121_01140 [Acidimicrobiia bacterium]|nr:hypothetical protein [Acidimicrobiia bacterium]MYC45087.1 hypothetical protein [Acidimicrobiia bacterium]MYI18726.1 hypothetical protein [Acidimicrobiia bacterium]